MVRAWVAVALLCVVGCTTTDGPERLPTGEAETTPPERQVECVPETCASVSRSCGQVDDGCGNVLECGACAQGQTCTGAGACEAVTTGPNCTPKSCAQLGATCGQVTDGCGGVLTCGQCAAGQSCGAANTCGTAACTPKSCAELQAACGAASDGCGAVVQCGVCGEGKQCTQNQCVTVTPAAQPGSTRWMKDLDAVAYGLKLDAAGNIYTSESRPREYGMFAVAFRKLSPDGVVLGSTREFNGMNGFDVSPLGNLFVAFNDCPDAPTGDCMGLEKLTVGGATAWRRDLPRIASAPAVDDHGSTWVVRATVFNEATQAYDFMLQKYGWDGALLIDKQVSFAHPMRLAAAPSDALIVSGRGKGANVLVGDPATYVAENVPFVMKLTASGAFVWLKRIEGMNGEVNQLHTTAAGTVVFDAYLVGAFDFNGGHAVTQDEHYLFVMEANGTPRFAKSLSDALTFPNPQLAGVDPQGRAIVIGAEFEPRRSHVVAYDLDGAKRWHRTITGALVHGAAVSSDRSVLISGSYNGTVDFGLGPKTAPAPDAGFLLRLNE